MYNMSKSTYSCDVCGFEGEWDAHDDIHGDIWECECCGTHFCTDCFVKEVGREAFDRMMRESDRVLCVKHFQEEVHDYNFRPIGFRELQKEENSDPEK